jgi:hypothetical protein
MSKHFKTSAELEQGEAKSRQEAQSVKDELSFRSMAEAEERAQAGLIASKAADERGINLPAEKAEILLESAALERRHDEEMRAKYDADKARDEAPRDDFDTVRAHGSTLESLHQQIRALRDVSAPKVPSPPVLTERDRVRIEAEQAHGREVAAKNAAKSRPGPAPRDPSDGYSTPAFQPNPTQKEVFPVSSKTGTTVSA